VSFSGAGAIQMVLRGGSWEAEHYAQAPARDMGLVTDPEHRERSSADGSSFRTTIAARSADFGALRESPGRNISLCFSRETAMAGRKESGLTAGE
jgi:hypothetical protein